VSIFQHSVVLFPDTGVFVAMGVTTWCWTYQILLQTSARVH